MKTIDTEDEAAKALIGVVFIIFASNDYSLKSFLENHFTLIQQGDECDERTLLYCDGTVPFCDATCASRVWFSGSSIVSVVQNHTDAVIVSRFDIRKIYSSYFLSSCSA